MEDFADPSIETTVPYLHADSVSHTAPTPFIQPPPRVVAVRLLEVVTKFRRVAVTKYALQAE